MHKSGTTLVSELLHKSGINMVDVFDTEKDYSSGNKVERASTLDLNQKILKSTKVFSLDISTDISHVQLEQEQKTKMRSIINECNSKYESWGFKDPRTSITYPLWKEMLPTHKLIVVYRHPSQVVNRYRRRVGILQRWSRAQRAYKIWTGTNSRILEFIKSTNYPILVINYHDLLVDDHTFQSLSTFVNRPLTDARKFTKRKTPRPDLMFKIIELFNRGEGKCVFRQLESHKSLMN